MYRPARGRTFGPSAAIGYRACAVRKLVPTVGTGLRPRAGSVLAVLAWLVCAPPAWAQATLIDEFRFGFVVHSIEPSNAEDGVDVNLELLLRRPAARYGDPFLDFALRPRLHLGTSINTVGDTSQLYGGLTWDVKLTQKLSLELSFGGAVHNGPTGDHLADSYGCAPSFRESLSLGYALDDRWTIYGTVAHMSNAGLCDHNTGLSSAGIRLGYKLK